MVSEYHAQSLISDPVELKAQLQSSGCILFRNLVHSVGQLETITRDWFGRFHQPATRVNTRGVSVDGYTSQVGTVGNLLGHSEGYYRPCFPPPDVCVFWCKRAPRVQGGETTWLDGAELFNALPANLAERMLQEPIVYESLWSSDRWQAEFNVSDVTALKSLLDADSRCRYSLKEMGNELHLFFRNPGVLTDALGATRFINGLLAHLPDVRHPKYQGKVYHKPENLMHWGDGGQLDNETIHAMIDAHDSVLHKHRWQDGDLLVLDNHQIMHGRAVMTEPDERVIFSRFGYWN